MVNVGGVVMGTGGGTGLRAELGAVLGKEEDRAVMGKEVARDWGGAEFLGGVSGAERLGELTGMIGWQAGVFDGRAKVLDRQAVRISLVE